MQFKKHLPFAPILAGILLLIGVILLRPASPVNAQCGSQASSCKNCHETQAKDPVNADGTSWHVGHAFGDFCYLCHAGNNQSMDQDQAHTGMVDPMSDVQAACASCHPNDLMEKAGVYASTLGVEIGMGGGASAAPSGGSGGETGGDSGGEASGSPENPPAESSGGALVVESGDVVDYSLQYDETVLGMVTINWGNVILWLIILGIAVGGGIFIYWNERRLKGEPMFAGAPKSSASAEVEAPVVEGYTAEVTSLLPSIAKLNPQGIHALKKILANPDQANELLLSVSRLDPELVQRLRALDRDSRALLIAAVGD